ncbi:hypothetical protein AVEN_179761-1 [Araneus ventricosus]|uniref:Secreted protein n=1 Tax=Araneus ventricosus TaxID=182803 RepID=A0A4Y2JEF7_ARAVE|nr:hypothetical protein AVEN_179761-1 [Araneus ventricosus]
MFTLPALLYLKLLPLFGQCLYHLIIPNKSRPPHAGGALPAGPLPALHSSWVGRASVGIFTTLDLTCIRPNTRWTFSGIRFRTWTSPDLRPRTYHYTTAILGHATSI